MGVYLLDCTLRDGGHVVKFDFGRSRMEFLLKNLKKAEIDYVEAGFLRDCEYSENLALYNHVWEFQRFLGNESYPAHYVLMVQVDQYDINKLEKCSGAVKNIRVSFHHDEIDVGMKYCRRVMDKGYRCHVNPINFVGYPDQDKVHLIHRVNELCPAYFTIVDTNGLMLPKELEHIARLADGELKHGIGIGLHLHDNLKIAFALAQVFLDMDMEKRELIIDASLDGFGKAPGNLCLELIAWYLNEHFHKSYDLKKIYYLMDVFIKPLAREYNWGYHPCYALSAQYRMSRNYAQYFAEKHQVGTELLADLLCEVKKYENGRYREDFAEDIYNRKMKALEGMLLTKREAGIEYVRTDYGIHTGEREKRQTAEQKYFTVWRNNIVGT